RQGHAVPHLHPLAGAPVSWALGQPGHCGASQRPLQRRWAPGETSCLRRDPRVNALMLAKLNTFALVGIDAVPVEVEVDASPGLPKTVLVGLPEMAVKESTHRIERSLANLGYQRHAGRLVINLAPGDLRKEATAFDLPIALGMLVATGQLLPDSLREVAVIGELALDGSVRPVKGALSIAMAARARGLRRLVVPAANAHEASVVTAVEVFGVGSLGEAVG